MGLFEVGSIGAFLPTAPWRQAGVTDCAVFAGLFLKNCDWRDGAG